MANPMNMDGYSGKKMSRGIITPRKGSSIALKNGASQRDQDAQFCKRIGCSGRIKYSQNSSAGVLDKAKCSNPSLCSSHGKEITPSSSRTRSAMPNAKKSSVDTKRSLSSQPEFEMTESSVSGESEAPSPQKEPRSKTIRAKSAIGSSSVTSNSRSREIFRQESQSRNENTLPASSVSSVSKSSAPSAVSRYGLRSMKCNSISDVVQETGASSGSKPNGKSLMKKRNSEGESSSSQRGKRLTSSSTPKDARISPSTSGISISDSARRVRSPREDGGFAGSIRAPRSVRLSNGRNNNPSLLEPSVEASRFPAPRMPIHVGGSRSTSQRFSTAASSSGLSSYSLSSSNGENLSGLMPFTSSDLGLSRLIDSERLQRYNMDGIAEVLLALQRIEQDEELTDEQVVALETSLFLGGYNYYDQHRDMRLDIDNMSYEELLALEERMGTVSTGIPEEALPKYLRKSIHQAAPSEIQDVDSCEDGDDIKCSICQEEYDLGDEIGTLSGCKHGYHLTCINQWLRLKNWCPICKAAAAPSQSSSS